MCVTVYIVRMCTCIQYEQTLSSLHIRSFTCTYTCTCTCTCTLAQQSEGREGGRERGKKGEGGREGGREGGIEVRERGEGGLRDIHVPVA